jgi:hypothetical protein
VLERSRRSPDVVPTCARSVLGRYARVAPGLWRVAVGRHAPSPWVALRCSHFRCVTHVCDHQRSSFGVDGVLGATLALFLWCRVILITACSCIACIARHTHLILRVSRLDSRVYWYCATARAGPACPVGHRACNVVGLPAVNTGVRRSDSETGRVTTYLFAHRTSGRTGPRGIPAAPRAERPWRPAGAGSSQRSSAAVF